MSVKRLFCGLRVQQCIDTLLAAYKHSARTHIGLGTKNIVRTRNIRAGSFRSELSVYETLSLSSYSGNQVFRFQFSADRLC